MVMVASAAAILGVAATATPASAVGKDGVVESGELALYYLTDFRAPIFDLYVSDDNFADDWFPLSPSINTDNNTESGWNNDTYYWHVHTGAGYTGSDGCIPPGAFGNFNATFKNTISSARYTSTPC